MARPYKKPILTLLESIDEITGQPSLANLGSALMPLLKAGKVLLLVDGLDEIHDDADRTTFVDHLETFIDEFKLIRLVVTSREAGFSLVAPQVARFCKQWRVAPLDKDGVEELCNHWHRLMTGTAPDQIAEAKEVANRLLETESLRRLAENPLLLTMLLVVKHGAGRLPPDRVSLYERAVEVLLDTWNIRGHEPLNLKEAVPQLACVAYELLRQGKQSATKSELLSLLEEARDRVPQVRRYSTDSPEKFLKRVELRSSLLVEAGHQLEKGRAVPFYQFRHLTFQEYLAAVATVDGHYFDYEKGDTVLKPLEAYLLSDEWKEVVPMAAVLAGKQAEPLMSALVLEGNGARRKLELGQKFKGGKEWRTYPAKLPAAASRLVQCLVEEAEATAETLSVALQIVVLFAKGCRIGENWQALSRGPYGEELLHQAWQVYREMKWPKECWLTQTFASLAADRKASDFWYSDVGKIEIARMLESSEIEEVVRGILTLGGLYWNGSRSNRHSGFTRGDLCDS